MARIIENLEEKLIDQALCILRSEGYGALTIRAVATGCGVGIGTVYNYFASKEELMAAALLSQWRSSVNQLQSVCDSAENAEEATHAIYDHIRVFGHEYMSVLGNSEAISAFVTPNSPYNTLLLQQFSRCLRRFCDSDFGSLFIAQCVLGCTLRNRSFEESWTMIKKLF